MANSKLTISSSSNTYSGTLSSLSPSTKYYVRAYAKNASGTYYSSQKEFTTSAGSITFSTPTISNIQSQSATATVTIQDTGGGTITERGFCYSTSTNPTVSNSKVTVSSSNNTYSGSLSSLSPSTKYYVRAYAKNASGTYYSSQKEFTTSAGSITFSTPTISNIQSQSATATVTIQDTGGGTITERGFCYSTSTNPTVANGKLTISSSSNTYSGTIPSLSPSTVYYVRAYAKNVSGTYYSPQEVFTTSATGSVTFGAMTITSLMSTSAYVTGNYGGTGGYTITELGFCYATTSYPTISNYKKVISSSSVSYNTSHSGSFSGELSPLTPSTKYYVRAYAKTTVGTFYSGQLAFTTTGQTNVAFDDEAFKSYCLKNYDTNGDGQISLSEVESVTLLSVSRMSICSLKGIEFFTGLKTLVCRGNQLQSLDLSNNPHLTTLSCYENQLTALNVSNCKQLTTIECFDNQLVTRDVSNNTQLKTLSCYNNLLKTLDVKHNTQITSLSCYNNQLAALDVSNNAQLKHLSCKDNQIEALELRSNMSLERLYCQDNLLTELDVSSNTNLISLDCRRNPNLTTIWLSQNQSIQYFDYDSYSTIHYK